MRPPSAEEERLTAITDYLQWRLSRSGGECVAKAPTEIATAISKYGHYELFRPTGKKVKYLMLGPHRYWMTGRGAVLHRALETSVSDLHDRSPLATMDDADQFQERLLEGVFDDLIVREGWERGGAAFTAAVERLGTEPNYRDPPPLKPFGPPRKMSSPEEVIVTSIEREERLAALSRRQRQAVKLLDEGCSYAETAGQMGMKENALYALVYRAKKKICS